VLLAAAGSIDVVAAEPLALEVERAAPAFDPQTDEPIVRFTFTAASKQLFADFTTQNIGRTIELRVDRRVIMKTAIRQPIYGGTGTIAGGFTADEAADIALRLATGAAKLEVEVVPD
jgi:preprotein translocase subunit SecD